MDVRYELVWRPFIVLVVAVAEGEYPKRKLPKGECLISMFRPPTGLLD